jgi:hypothetical protein
MVTGVRIGTSLAVRKKEAKNILAAVRGYPGMAATISPSMTK